MGIYIGNTSLKNISLGGSSVKSVHLGSDLVRPAWIPGVNTIAYYPLATDANDYSGNNNHITNYNFTFSGGVANFDGSQKGSVPSLTGYKTISLRCSATVFNFMVFSGDSDYQYYPQILDYRTSQGNGTSSHNYDAPYGRTLNTLEWHLFTLSQDNGVVNLYLDGELYNTRQCTFSRAIKNIGWGQYWNRYYLNGRLSNVIIESKARTAEEIANYYNQIKSNYEL